MMKRIAILLAMAPALASANDLAVGTFELSGATNLSFESTSLKPDGGQSVDFGTTNLSGTGLYYVAPNVGVGARLGYLSQSVKVAGQKTTESEFFLGPAAAYEIPVAPELAVFGLLTVGYVSRTVEDAGASVTLAGPGFGLEAGVKYFPVKMLSVDAALGYRYASLSSDTSPSVDFSNSGFGLNVGLSLYFGGGPGH
jgi:hypothetical protein